MDPRDKFCSPIQGISYLVLINLFILNHKQIAQQFSQPLLLSRSSNSSLQNVLQTLLISLYNERST